MSRGNNRVPIVSRRFLTRSCPRSSCLLLASQIVSRPQERALKCLSGIDPRAEGDCETSERRRLSRAYLCLEASRFRRLYVACDVFYSLLFRGFFVALISLAKQCFGHFPWLFRGPRFGQILHVPLGTKTLPN